MKRIVHLVLLGRTLALYYLQFWLLNSRWMLLKLGIIRQRNSVGCVISLTSYPERIKSLNIVLKCLINQSVRVQEIRVYIDAGNEEKFGILINRYKPYGVKFISCDEALRSYTKLIPILKEVYAIPIISVDDDVLYSKTMVEELWNFHEFFPTCAIGHRGVLRPLDSSLETTYKRWPEAKYSGNPTNSVLLTGMAGILYPPNSFHEIVLDSVMFKKLAPTADDLWFNYCLRKRGTKSFLIANKNGDPFSIKGSQSSALWMKNVDELGNDFQLQNIIGALGPLD